jgi:non-canonical (house-cleaning) NTP pyrophosphatase
VVDLSVCSASAIKRDAVKKALPDCQLQVYNVESGVPPQPVGKVRVLRFIFLLLTLSSLRRRLRRCERFSNRSRVSNFTDESSQGAMNRCKGAKLRAVGPVDVCIGIEVTQLFVAVCLLTVDA